MAFDQKNVAAILPLHPEKAAWTPKESTQKGTCETAVGLPCFYLKKLRKLVGASSV
jgi:hypothetical protein